jgi:hypothetical protein
MLSKTNHRTWGTVIFAMLFVLLGALIPDVYFRYFDKTEYYVINSIKVDDSKTYKACEVQEIEITRTALENLTGEFMFILSLEDIDNRNVYSKTIPSTVEKGSRTIKSEQLLPCKAGVGTDIREGKYRWTLSYEYEFRGVKRVALNKSNLFLIK